MLLHVTLLCAVSSVFESSLLFFMNKRVLVKDVKGKHQQSGTDGFEPSADQEQHKVLDRLRPDLLDTTVWFLLKKFRSFYLNISHTGKNSQRTKQLITFVPWTVHLCLIWNRSNTSIRLAFCTLYLTHLQLWSERFKCVWGCETLLLH